MKTFVVLVAIALMAHNTKQECCPEVDGVKNAINYLHLFKSQADGDFNFYDITTTAELVHQEAESTITIDGVVYNVQKTVIRLTEDKQPVRYYYYMQEAYFNSNGSLFKVNKFNRIRRKGGMTEDDVKDYAVAFLGLSTIANGTWAVAANVVDCCFMKMEYINFYYLYANYFSEGRGTALTC